MTAVPPIATRRATPEDLDALLATAQAGLDSYAAFAPVGWQAPDVTANHDRTAALIADPDTWALLALFKQRPIGHVALLPAREQAVGGRRRGRRDRRPIPGAVDLGQLFVMSDWWGRGVGALLYEGARAEMRARRYQRARLITPSLHARSRRFFERRGWRAAGEQWIEELALPCTEYRLELG